MGKIISIVLSAVGLFEVQLTQGQGSLYLSNLAQTSLGGVAVASDAWIAQSFITGTNLGGYALNSVQLLIAPASGNPAGFSLAIYSHAAGNSRFPGSLLGVLSGPDPTPSGTFDYNTAWIPLSPSTTYFVVLTAATPRVTGNYSWSFTNPFNSAASGGWLMEGFRFSSADGLAWSRLGGGELQFAIYATAVPEPRTSALAGLGLVGLGFCWYQRGRVKRFAGTKSAIDDRTYDSAVFIKAWSPRSCCECQ